MILTWPTCQYHSSIIKHIKAVISEHRFLNISNYCILTFIWIQVVFLFLLLRQHFLFVFCFLFRPCVAKLMTNYLLLKIFWHVSAFLFCVCLYRVLFTKSVSSYRHCVLVLRSLFSLIYVYLHRSISTLLSCLVQHVITYDSGSQTLSVHGALSATTIFTAPLGQKKYLTFPFIK
jgi:hypothetical protein